MHRIGCRLLRGKWWMQLAAQPGAFHQLFVIHSRLRLKDMQGLSGRIIPLAAKCPNIQNGFYRMPPRLPLSSRVSLMFSIALEAFIYTRVALHGSAAVIVLDAKNLYSELFPLSIDRYKLRPHLSSSLLSPRQLCDNALLTPSSSPRQLRDSTHARLSLHRLTSSSFCLLRSCTGIACSVNLACCTNACPLKSV